MSVSRVRKVRTSASRRFMFRVQSEVLPMPENFFERIVQVGTLVLICYKAKITCVYVFLVLQYKLIMVYSVFSPHLLPLRK